MPVFDLRDGESVSRNERLKAKNELQRSRIKRGGSGLGGSFVPEGEAGLGLKRAVVIMPVVIIVIIIITLLVGLHQFRSLYDADMSSRHESVVSRAEKETDEGKLLLTVSPSEPLPSDFRTDLVSVEDIQVDRIMLNDLKAMLAAAEKDGLALRLTGGYVSAEQQQEMFSSEVSRLMSSEGLTNTNAIEKAEKTIPAGDHSERQSGMLVTFASGKDKDFSQTEEYRWLIRNSMKYGFILRYPESGEKSTGFSFDPTAFRYVGKENASKIVTLNMTLEDYSSYLKSREN